MFSFVLTYKYELTLMEPRESILVAAHNSLISEIRKNFLYKVGRRGNNVLLPRDTSLLFKKFIEFP